MVPLSRPSSLGTLRLYTSFIIFILAFITFISHFFGNIDYCYRERIYDKSWKRHGYLVLSFLSVLVSGFLIVIWKPFKSLNQKDNNNYTRSTFYIIYTFLWYGATFLFCYFGKQILKDTLCNRSPNSVSGHFLFHTFFLLAIPYWFFAIGRFSFKDSQRNSSAQRNELQLVKKLLLSNNMVIFIFISYIGYIFSSFINLEATWSHGFHTLRQILYGSILALTSIYSLLLLTGYVGTKTEKSLTKLVNVLAIYWIAGVSLILISGLRFPYSLTEIVFGGCLFGYLFYISRIAPLPTNIATKYKRPTIKKKMN